MNEPKNQQVEKPKSTSNNIWIIILFVFLFTLSASIGIYFWQRLSTEKKNKESFMQSKNELQSQIILLEKEITELKNSQDNNSYTDWKTYTDPENIYSVKVPPDWQIDSQWEQGNNLPDDHISYTSFTRKQGYMILNISKLYSHTPEYQCEPKGEDFNNLSPLEIDGYKTYQAFSIFNLDTDYQDTTSYNYCIDINGKKLHFEFVPEASDNNPTGINILYNILATIDFK